MFDAVEILAIVVDMLKTRVATKGQTHTTRPPYSRPCFYFRTHAEYLSDGMFADGIYEKYHRLCLASGLVAATTGAEHYRQHTPYLTLSIPARAATQHHSAIQWVRYTSQTAQGGNEIFLVQRSVCQIFYNCV